MAKTVNNALSATSNHTSGSSNAGMKAHSIGIVKVAIGEVHAVNASGGTCRLQPGDKVYPNDIVQTGELGSVQIEFANGEVANLGRESSLLLDTDIFDPSKIQTANDDTSRIQSLIASGADPTQVTKASAAGNAADDQRHGIVEVEQTGKSGVVTGVDSGDLGNSGKFHTVVSGAEGTAGVTTGYATTANPAEIAKAAVDASSQAAAKAAADAAAAKAAAEAAAKAAADAAAAKVAADAAAKAAADAAAQAAADAAAKAATDAAAKAAADAAAQAAAAAKAAADAAAKAATDAAAQAAADAAAKAAAAQAAADAEAVAKAAADTAAQTAADAAAKAAAAQAAADAAAKAAADAHAAEDVADTTPPADPTIVVSRLTNDNTPTITGTAEPGSTVRVEVHSTPQYFSTTAKADGTWSIQVPEDKQHLLEDGTHTVTAQAIDAAGNASGSVVVGFSVDTVAGPLTIEHGGTTNDSTPAIKGNAEAGSTIVVTLSGVAGAYTATAGADGSWSVTPAGLADGTYTISAKETDAAGNVSNVVTDSIAIHTLALPDSSLHLTTESDTGSNHTDRITRDPTPEITGTAQTGSTVAVVISHDGVQVGSTLLTQTDTHGTWSVTPGANLASDNYTVTATVTDPSGYRTVETKGLVIDTVSPTPTITTTTSTDHPASTIVGTAEADSTVTVTLVGSETKTLTAITDNKGDWTLNHDLPLNGTFSLTAKATDIAGNVSDSSPAKTLEINTSHNAQISGTTADAVTEDGNKVTAAGTLTITDVDAGQAHFQTPTSLAGTYGEFKFNADTGVWSYQLDNAKVATQALAADAQAHDTLTVTSLDGTASQVIDVTINGTNDAAVLSSASVALDETNAPLTTSGTLTISDVDNPATFVAQTNVAGTNGHFSIGTDGAWTYTANSANDALNVGQSVSDTFQVAAADGTKSAVTVTINGTNDAAILSSASVALDETNAPLTTSGTLTISDVDNPATFVAQTNVAGTNGHFSIGTDGAWTYTANSANDALNVGQSVSDTFQVAAADGTKSTVTVTINGTNDAPIVVSGDDSRDDSSSHQSAGDGSTSPVNHDSSSHESTGAGSTPPVNHDPVAVADKGTTTENTPVTINVLTNDSDPDKNTLSVTGATVSSDKGTVHVNDNGTLTFTPAKDFHGDATINYTISDGHGGTDSSTVAVVVVAVNQAPALTDRPAQLSAVDEDHSKTISTSDLLKGYTDADHDTLSVRGLSADHGTVTTNENGSFTITPTGNYNGPIHLTYTVSDGQGGNTQATQSFTVTAVNDAPTLTSALATLAPSAEDTAKSISAADLIKGYTDVDGDKMSVQNLSATHGKITGSGDTFTFTPDANYNGEVRLNYTVSDGQGGNTQATQSFTVTAVNDAPTLTSALATLAPSPEDTAKSISAADLLKGYTDVDGDTMSVQNISATHGKITGSGDTFTFTPDANYNGQVQLNYDVSDGHGGSVKASQNFTITPVNDAPALTGSQTQLADVAKGATTSITAHDLLNGFTDPEGDTISVSNLHASQGTISAGSNGNFTFTSDTTGPVVLSYNVIDGHGGTTAATESFSVTGSSNSSSQGSDQSNVTVHVDKTFGDVLNLNDLLGHGGVLSFDSISTKGNNTTVNISIDPDGPKGHEDAVKLATVTITGLHNATSQEIMNVLLDQHDLKL